MTSPGAKRGPVLASTAQAPWQFAAPWGARGFISDLDGPVHWVEFGAPTAAPPIVFVHGLGGSHLNWVHVGSDLTTDRQGLALDLSGFGLTRGTRRTASITANTGLLNRFITDIAGQPVILVGNSMGGMLSILQATAHPESVAGLVLIAPALPTRLRRPDLRVASQFLMYALPGAGEAYLKAMSRRLTARQVVLGVINLCFANPARAEPAMVEATIALAELRRATPATDEPLLAAARSLMRVLGRPERYWAAMAGIDVPVLLLGGSADRLVPAASIRAASARNPGWQTELFDGVGHTPQLETPRPVVSLIQGWLARNFPPSQQEE